MFPFVVKFLYQNIFKQIAFLQDPEDVHDRISYFGEFLGRFGCTKWITKKLLSYENKQLEQTIAGICFKNPIGLSAGFDKNAQLTQILPSVGFGFEEAGSITGEPCPGNPKPRLWRLKKSKSLLVYYGLKNDGCEVISEQLKNEKFEIPLGISIAKTNSPFTVKEEDGIADYVKVYKTFAEKNIGSYFTINISCPNAFGGEPFTDPEKLDRLLFAIRTIPNSKPVFLKMPAEISFEIVDTIIELARKYKITGFVSTNLAKDRKNPQVFDTNVPTTGGMSGKVVQKLSDEQIAYIYKKTKGEFIIMGVGGVFSAEDAYKKIRLGASLVQLITGMIYEGPQLIGDINRGLVKLLERDGFKNISEAIGVDNK